MKGQCAVQDWPYASFSGEHGSAQVGGATCGSMARPPVDAVTYATVLTGVQFVLDGIGLIPVFGEAADGLNAFISGCRGDYVGAALSIVCMVPVAGYIGNALKAGRHLPPSGAVSMLRSLGKPALEAIADATGELAQFLGSLPDKLPDVVRKLRRWQAISDETMRALNRALEPVLRGIDEAFAQVMNQIDHALNGQPGAFAMAGTNKPAPRYNAMHTSSHRGGGNRVTSGAARTFKQGDHLVNSGLRKVLDELALLDGQSARLIGEARAILKDPSFLATINKGAHGADANSAAFGRAAQRVRDAAAVFRTAKGPGQVSARGLSLRAELRDMLNAAVDVEAADLMNPSQVRAVQDQLIGVWAKLDGAVARSTQASGLIPLN